MKCKRKNNAPITGALKFIIIPLGIVGTVLLSVLNMMMNLYYSAVLHGRHAGNRWDGSAVQIARNLKAMGLNPDQIAKATGLTVAEINCNDFCNVEAE